MRGRNPLLVELAGDLGEAVAAGVLEADPLDHLAGQGRRPAGAAGLAGLARLREVLAQETLELAYAELLDD